MEPLRLLGQLYALLPPSYTSIYRLDITGGRRLRLCTRFLLYLYTTMIYYSYLIFILTRIVFNVYDMVHLICGIFSHIFVKAYYSELKAEMNGEFGDLFRVWLCYDRVLGNLEWFIRGGGWKRLVKAVQIRRSFSSS